jgi:hypothetical protein
MCWENIVSVFSDGALTRPEDKLVAISGIARVLQPVLQDYYLAGLWKRQLLRGLMWSVDKDGSGIDGDAVRASPYGGKYFALLALMIVSILSSDFCSTIMVLGLSGWFNLSLATR